jgi:long-chain fatty acid transport protein
MKILRRCVAAAGAVALTTAGGAREAKAAGFANTRMGGEEGTVVSTNPTALYYNPGAMGFSTGSQLGLYGSLALRHATFSRTTAPSDLTGPNTQVGNTGEAHAFNAFGGPTIGGTLKIGHLVIGAGFFAPFYGRVHWAKNDSLGADAQKYPLATAGVQRWFSTDGALTTLYFTAGAAYRIGPLSLGATGNFISSTIDQTQAKNPGGKGLPDTTAEQRSFIDAHAFNGSFAVGAMFEALPDQVWIGASYQAQPGLGEQRLKGIQVTGKEIPGAFPYQIYFTQDLPDIVRAGVKWRLKHAPLEFRLFGDLTRWSHFDHQCLYLQTSSCAIGADGSAIGSGGTLQYVHRNWKDTWGGRLGVSIWPTKTVELLLGAGYETAAVPGATLAPDIPDANNVSGTVGARFRVTDSLFLSVEYAHIQYMNRDNVGKSTLAVDANGKPISTPTVEQDGGGQYTQWIGQFTGNVEAIF